jgi:hypothetical protein
MEKHSPCNRSQTFDIIRNTFITEFLQLVEIYLFLIESIHYAHWVFLYSQRYMIYLFALKKTFEDGVYSFFTLRCVKLHFRLNGVFGWLGAKCIEFAFYYGGRCLLSLLRCSYFCIDLVFHWYHCKSIYVWLIFVLCSRSKWVRFLFQWESLFD